MDLDADTFRSIVNATAGKPEAGYRDAPARLTASEGIALVRLARLAVDADDREDQEEMAFLEKVVAHVCALADITAPPEQDLPHDDEERVEQLADIASALVGKPSAALGYAIAYMMTISDLDVAPVEATFVEDAGEALDIDPEHGDELIATVGALLTPAA